MTEKLSSEIVSTKLERIAKLAMQMPDVAFTTLAHHIDLDWLKEAYRRTRKDGAAGGDGQTAMDYAENLEENLRSLLDRAKSGDRYRALPVRRVHIPKGDGRKTRPIGIPAFEDKLLQRAVAMVLGAICEQDFMECSYVFDPNVRRIKRWRLSGSGRWILETAGFWRRTSEDFFGTVGLPQLRSILRRRVQDGVILRLIDKWLKAGVMEEGNVYHPKSGVPQGGVISPLLSNMYLHEVLDQWFEQEVKPRLKGPAFLVRYADDFIILFKDEDDARRVLDVLPKRFGRYGLRLHPDKTRLLRFSRPNQFSKGRTSQVERSFDLLGLTFYWRLSRRGRWVVKRKTAKNRLRRSLRSISVWC